MNKKDINTPGYTVTESMILHEMLDVMCDFVDKGNWEAQLPMEVNRSFIHDILGNCICFTLKLYTEINKNESQVEYNLFFSNKIEGTKKERWDYADGGFFLSFGNQDQIKADLLSFKNNIDIVQEKLFEDYFGIFYNN